jgi:hypothetical protein
MSTFHQYINNAIGTVQNNPLSSGGTTLTTDSTLGTKLAALTFPYFLTIWGANLNPNTDANMEIVTVTANPTSNNFTITRGSQSTTGVSHAQGSNIALLWTAGNANDAIPSGTTSQGSIYYINGSNLPALLAPGSAGTVLSSNGASANPSFISVPSITFGDGSDGTVTISSPTTLTRDMYYSSLTVNSTLTTDGFRIYVSGTINGSGTITFGTGNTGSGFFKVNLGGAGGTGRSNANGNIGTTPTAANSIGTLTAAGAGGLGGQGSNGPATGGTATAVVQRFGIIASLTYLGLDFSLTGTFTPVTSSSAGAGGSGGGGTGGSAIGGTGGTGGNSGGTVWISAAIWAGTFVIAAPGNAGLTGSNFTAGSGGAGGGGGGGGGNGGVTVTIYGTKTWSGSYSIAGGSGGGGGTGTGGNNGSSGSSGSSGVSYELIASSAFLR